jgi:AcrR family transcriptional regulator
MPKVTEDHRLERRAQIASAALRCFSRKGFDSTSMADIIAESGLSAGAIYLHYKNKGDLVDSVVDAVLRDRAADLVDIESRESLPAPAEVVEMFVRGMKRDLETPGILVQVWSTAATDPGTRRLADRALGEITAIWTRYLTVWLQRQGLEAGAAAARATVLTPVALALCQGYILQSAVMDGFDGDAYLAAVREVRFS